jgi:hypothetical protein
MSAVHLAYCSECFTVRMFPEPVGFGEWKPCAVCRCNQYFFPIEPTRSLTETGLEFREEDRPEDASSEK